MNHSFSVPGQANKLKKFFTVIDVDAGYVSYALVYICNDNGSTISGTKNLKCFELCCFKFQLCCFNLNFFPYENINTNIAFEI